MRAVRIGLLVILTALCLAQADSAPAMPRSQTSSGIPPFVWSLTAFPGVGPIAEPGRYTVQFMADGTVGIGADCNRSAGVWSGGDGAIDITATISTLALCPEGSLGQTFLDTLNAVSGYTLSGGTLTLHGAAGEMTFSA